MTRAATPTPNWPYVPKLVVETSEWRVGRATPIDEKLVVKLPTASPWKSWKTLAEANGCHTTLPDVTLVPTRTLTRPRALSTSLIARSHGGIATPLGPVPPDPRTIVPETLS